MHLLILCPYLEVGEGVQGEDHGGDDDEADGDQGHDLNKKHFLNFLLLSVYPGSKRGVWFLKKIPETLLDASQSARAEELRLLNLVLGGVKDLVTGLEHHLLHPVEGHELSRLVVALLAAGFQVELIDAPVVEVLLERDHASLLFRSSS